MSRKRSELYDKLTWSRAATEEEAAAHRNGRPTSPVPGTGAAWPPVIPHQQQQREQQQHGSRSRSVSPQEGNQRQRVNTPSNWAAPPKVHPYNSALGAAFTHGPGAGQHFPRIPKPGRHRSPTGHLPSERPSTTFSQGLASRPFTAPTTTQPSRPSQSNALGGPASPSLFPDANRPRSQSVLSQAPGLRPAVSRQSLDRAGLPLMPTQYGGGAWRPEFTLPRDPAAMSREELSLTYGQTWERWERAGHTNVVSRTFRLGAPLTTAEMAGVGRSSRNQNALSTTLAVEPDALALAAAAAEAAVAATRKQRYSRRAAAAAAAASGQPPADSGADGGGGGGGEAPVEPAADEATALEADVIEPCSPPSGEPDDPADVARPEDSPRLLRLRSKQMSVKQKLEDVKQTTERQVDYIRMQREYVEERLHKMRTAPGYRLIVDAKAKLPALSTALAALVRREAEVKRDQDLAMGEEDEGEEASNVPSPFEGLMMRYREGNEKALRVQAGEVHLLGRGLNTALSGSSTRLPAPVQAGIMFAGSRQFSRSASRHSGNSHNSPRGGLGRNLSTSISIKRSIKRGMSIGKSMDGLPQVDTSHLFIPDVSIQPDAENEEELDTALKRLKDASDAPGNDDKSTYSHLVKPALNSASSPFAIPGLEQWDSTVTLNWSCRGIGEKKMGVLRDTLLQNSFLTGLQLAGNNLTDKCVADVLAVLSQPEAPPMKQVDFSSNTALGWRCAYPLAAALGAPEAAAPGGELGDAEPGGGGAAALLKSPILRLGLRRLVLSSVKIQDKGALILAVALKDNKVLKELNLSRCAITDQGGEGILQALAGGHLESLNLSWNSLRVDSARALHETLSTNGSLQELNLSYNGLSDADAAIVLMGLSRHGHWRRVDLSFNNLGAGSALVLSELLDLLGKRAAEQIKSGTYGENWDLERLPPGKVDTTGWIPVGEAATRPDPTSRFMHHEDLGRQLAQGPVLLDVGGNPLGFAGLRQLLHSLDWMSTVMEDAAVAAASANQQALKPSSAELDVLLPSWPLHLVISNCNVDLTDTPPEGSQMEGMDSHSPNPFLPSLLKVMLSAQAVAKKKGGKKDGGKQGEKKGKKGKGAKEAAAPGKEYFLTTQSQSLDLTSPAGKYKLDMSHPGSWLVVRHLLDLTKQLEAASADGLLHNVVVAFKDVMVNDRPSKVDKLASLQEVTQGTVSFTVAAPALLLATEPAAISDQVIEWVLVTLSDKSCSELWKLSVIQVACSHFYFNWEQALQLIDLFDAEMATSERLRAGEIMYSRCVNPLDFWLCAMPTMPLSQVEMLIQRFGELAALDIHNSSGRYMLNLSRSLDRFIAMRLQEVCALENSWMKDKYFVNWRNAMLNGSPLLREGLQKIRDYTIPDTGTLRVDYVTYQVPDPASEPCSEEQMRCLYAQIRAINGQYEAEVLKLREEYLPFGRLQSELESQPSLSRASSTSLPAGTKDDRPAWTGSMTLALTLPHLVTRLLNESTAASAATAALDDTPPPTRAWWAEAGFTAASSMLKKYAEMIKDREEAAKGAATQREDAEAGADPNRQRSPSRASPASPGPDKARPGTADGKGAAAAPKSPTGKGGKAGKGGAGGKAAKPVIPPPHPAPQNRTAGAHLTEKEEAQAEELAMQVLRLVRIQDVALLLSKFSSRHVARVLHIFLKADPEHGHKAAGMVLDCLAPTFAIRFLYDMFDQILPLLPPDARRRLLSGCRAGLLKNLNVLQGEVNGLALKRARQIRITLQCFASNNVITSVQLEETLRVLRFEQDRCTAMVALWSRIIDRQGIYLAYQSLTGNEQRQVMQRLGHWLVWTTLERPHGLHFYLDLTDPEQKDIAKDIIKLACKTSLGAKAQAKSTGSMPTAQQLVGLRGNGSPMSIPEDDKMWMMIESSYQSIEFDYVPTAEQIERRRLLGVIAIQRHWLWILHMRRKQREQQDGAHPAELPPPLPARLMRMSMNGRVSNNGAGRMSTNGMAPGANGAASRSSTRPPSRPSSSGLPLK